MSCNCGCGCVTSTLCISPCPCPETVDKSAENINLAGIGVYDGEVNDVFQFRGVRSVNSNIVVTLNTTFKTVDLELSSATFKATQTFANAASRALATPDFEGQIGVQLDTDVIYYSTGTAAGDWATDFNFLSGKTTAMATGTRVEVANAASIIVNAATANATWAFNGIAVTLSQPITLPVGAVGAPSTKFAGDASTGFYRVAAGQIGVSSSGTLVATFNSTGLVLAAGLALQTGTTLNLIAPSGVTTKGSMGATDFTQLSVVADITLHGGGDAGANGSIILETGTSAQGAGGDITLQALDVGNILLSTAGVASTITLDGNAGLNFAVAGTTRLTLPAGAIVPASSVLITSGVAGAISSALISTFISTANTQTGYTAFTNPVVRRTCDTTTVTLPELAQLVGTLIEDLKAVKLMAT